MTDTIREKRPRTEESSSFTEALSLIHTPQNNKVKEWMSWANNILDVCQEEESTKGVLPFFADEPFMRGKQFITHPCCNNAFTERTIIFCSLIALCHVSDTIQHGEESKVPFGAFISKQRQFFIEWVCEKETDANELSLLKELGELCRVIAPDNHWDDVQYLANVPSMQSISNKIDITLPVNRSSLSALLLSIKRRKTAAIVEKNETHIYCGIDSRTLRWQANWWIDFWKMRDYDNDVTKNARVYIPPENCTYTNYWILAALREIEWMKETLTYLQDYFFNDIALPGMSERGFQRAGFRNHSGNVLWAEFETLASNKLRSTMNHDALDVHNSLCDNGDGEFHWEMLRGIYTIVCRLVAMRFTKIKIDDRFFIYNMLSPKQKYIAGPDPILIGIRRHFVLIQGNERVLYKREHMLNAVADWMLLSFPENDRIRFLMTRFNDTKMISPHDIIAIQSAKIVSNDNSQRGFFRE